MPSLCVRLHGIEDNTVLVSLDVGVTIIFDNTNNLLLQVFHSDAGKHSSDDRNDIIQIAADLGCSCAIANFLHTHPREPCGDSAKSITWSTVRLVVDIRNLVLIKG